jgi:hypothetical protein
MSAKQAQLEKQSRQSRQASLANFSRQMQVAKARYGKRINAPNPMKNSSGEELNPTRRL